MSIMPNNGNDAPVHTVISFPLFAVSKIVKIGFTLHSNPTFPYTQHFIERIYVDVAGIILFVFNLHSIHKNIGS